MKIFQVAVMLSIVFSISGLDAQETNSLDTSKVAGIKGKLTLFSKNDDGVHAFRYLFSNSLQNKSSYLKFAERVLYSTSFVWIPTNGYYKELWHHEFTWYNSLSFNVNKSIYFGIHYLLIFTKGSIIYNDVSWARYGIYGFVMQYDFLPRFENRLYLETSINKGDFCTCGSDDPYRLDDLTYIGLGLGYDFPIYNRLTFRMGFTDYVIQNDVKHKSNFTQYILGLNVNLGKNSYRSDISFLELFN